MPTTVAASAKAAEPVWYFRQDVQSWWPAMQFPNVWTAYAICHEYYNLGNDDSCHHDNDNENSNNCNQKELTKSLFLDATSFYLEQTLAGRSDVPVLALLQTGFYNNGDDIGDIDINNTGDAAFFEFILRPDNCDNHVRKYLDGLDIFVQPNQSQQLKQTLPHFRRFMSSKAIFRDVHVSHSNSFPSSSSSEAETVAKITASALTNTTTTEPTPVTTSPSTRVIKPHPPPGGVPIIEGDPIGKDEPWETVYAKLKFSGFNERPTARGLVYTKPNGKIENPNDFFSTLDDLQAFCQRAYGWQGPKMEQPQDEDNDDDEEEERGDEDHDIRDDEYDEEESIDNSTIRTESVFTQPRRVSQASYHSKSGLANTNHAIKNMAMTPNNPTHPQDPGKPLLSSPERNSVASRASPDDTIGSVASDSTAAANRYWKKLKKLGWECRWGTGAHAAHCVYIRPGCTYGPSAMEGKDYYTGIVQMYLAETGRPPRQLGRGRRHRTLQPITKSRKTQKQAKQVTRGSRRGRVATVSPNNSTVTNSFDKKLRAVERSSSEKNSSTKQTSKPVPQNRPTWSKIRSILTNFCTFTAQDHGQIAHGDKIMDEMLAGMAMWQCGVPRWDQLSSTRQGLLKAWMARLYEKKSVDVSIREYLRRDMVALKSDLIALGISFSGEKIFLPNAPASSFRQVHHEHYYYEHELQTTFGSHLRRNFAHYVPDEPTLSQRQALDRIGNVWLSSLKPELPPPYRVYPKSTDEAFWEPLNKAGEVYCNDPNKAVKSVGSDNRSVVSSKSNQSSKSKRGGSPRKYVKFPTLKDGINILKKFGFYQSSEGTYRHTQHTEISCPTWKDLWNLVGREGIPSYSSRKQDFTQEQLQQLNLWRYAQKITEQQYNERGEKLADGKVRDLLLRGLWKTVDGRWIHYKSRADERQVGVHVFNQFEDVAYAMAMDDEIVVADTLTEEEILQLRLWAIQSPKYLIKDYRPPSTKRKRPLNLKDVMLQDKSCPFYKYYQKKKAKLSDTEKEDTHGNVCTKPSHPPQPPQVSVPEISLDFDLSATMEEVHINHDKVLEKASASNDIINPQSCKEKEAGEPRKIVANNQSQVSEDLLAAATPAQKKSNEPVSCTDTANNMVIDADAPANYTENATRASENTPPKMLLINKGNQQMTMDKKAGQYKGELFDESSGSAKQELDAKKQAIQSSPAGKANTSLDCVGHAGKKGRGTPPSVSHCSLLQMFSPQECEQNATSATTEHEGTIDEEDDHDKQGKAAQSIEESFDAPLLTQMGEGEDDSDHSIELNDFGMVDDDHFPSVLVGQGQATCVQGTVRFKSDISGANPKSSVAVLDDHANLDAERDHHFLLTQPCNDYGSDGEEDNDNNKHNGYSCNSGDDLSLRRATIDIDEFTTLPTPTGEKEVPDWIRGDESMTTDFGEL